MQRLVVFNRVTADGYFAAPDGNLDWVIPDPEVDKLGGSEMLPQHHEEVRIGSLRWRFRFRGIKRRRASVHDQFQGRQFRRTCLQDKAIRLMLDDTTDDATVEGRPQALR